MLNLNLSRKYSAGQFRSTVPPPNTETSKDLYSLIKKRVKEVHFAFLLIKFLDLHVSLSVCNMNSFDKMHQKTLQNILLYIFGNNLRYSCLSTLTKSSHSVFLQGKVTTLHIQTDSIFSLCYRSLQCLS